MSEKIETALFEISNHPTNGCDEKFAKGIESFALSLTPSHSLTSRPSVFPLLRKHLDRPLERVLTNYYQDEDRGCLAGFKVSNLRKTPRFLEKLNLKKNYLNEYSEVIENITNWENAIFRALKIEKIKIDIPSNIEPCLENINFEYTNKPRKVKLTNNEPHLAYDAFYGTLNTLLSLIHTLRILTPKKFTTKLSELKGDRITSKNASIYGNVRKFCDLCWKHSQGYEDYKKGIRTLRPSRFCSSHDPTNCSKNQEEERDSKTREARNSYQRDLRYKTRFQEQLSKLYDLEDKDFPIRPIFYLDLKYLYPQEHRKAAYDLVHSGLDTPHRKRIVKLIMAKMTNSEIARELKISRQAVSKTRKFFDNKIQELQKTVFIDEDTGGKIYP